MRARRLVPLFAVLCLLVPFVAHASPTAWDARDADTHLDLRWLSVRSVDDDWVRITLTTGTPVRRGMLPAYWQRTTPHRLWVMAQGYYRIGEYGEYYLHVSARTGNWVVSRYDGGSAGHMGTRGAQHPDPYTFVFRLPAEGARGIFAVSWDHHDPVTLIEDRLPVEGGITPR